MNHFYCFKWSEGADAPTYSRTFPERKYAVDWVNKQPESTRAFFTVDCLPKKFYY